MRHSPDRLMASGSTSQNRPGNIWSQFFAANRTISGTFNVWAAFRRYSAGSPVRYHLRGKTQRIAQFGQATSGMDSAVNWVHAQILNTMFSKGNRHV